MGVDTQYGPLLVWFQAFSAASGALWRPIAVFKLSLLLCAVITILAAFGFCRTRLPAERRGPAFVLLAWNPLFAWEISGQAHNDGLMVVACAAFVWAASADRQWLAVSFLAAAVYTKYAVAPVLGLYLIFIFRHRPWRGVAMAAGVAALGILLFAPFWEGHRSLQALIYMLNSPRDHLTNSLMASFCAAANLVGPSLGAATYWLWSVFGKLFCVGLAGYLTWRATIPQRVVRGGMLFLLLYLCLVAGWFHPWYATWLLPLALGVRDARLQRIVAVYTTLVLVLYVPYSALGIGPLLAAGIPLVMLWKYRNTARGDFRGAAVLGAVSPSPSS
jgi:hypothetical protein